MPQTDAEIQRMEKISFVFVLIVGALDHFIFSQTNWTLTAWFSPVNESVWEHLKIITFPMLLFAAYEWTQFTGSRKSNLIAAKAAGITVANVLIPAMFYTYHGLSDSMILDLVAFAVAVAAGHFVSYHLIVAQPVSRNIQFVSKAVLVAWVLAFVIITFYTPTAEIFRDPVTDTYGIPAA